MKLCGACRRKPWPFALALFIASFIAFVTWLTLAAAGLQSQAKFFGTATAFFLVTVVLFGYITACIRRHCHDDKHVV